MQRTAMTQPRKEDELQQASCFCQAPGAKLDI